MAAATAATSESESKDEIKLQILEIDGFFAWKWNISQDTCSICRNELSSFCIQCVSNNIQFTERHDSSSEVATGAGASETKTDDEKTKIMKGCEIHIGTCNHSYHGHCIQQWIKQRAVCPLCNVDWNILRILHQ